MTAPPVFAASGLDQRTLAELRERAMAAMDRAYAPYSGFRVGAALLGTGGGITDGCNVENASYPAGMCAERAALAAAVAQGERSFLAITIATEAHTPTPPCGLCRQALVEFSPGLAVISVTRNGHEAAWPLGTLLPQAFTQQSLDRSHR